MWFDPTFFSFYGPPRLLALLILQTPWTNSLLGYSSSAAIFCFTERLGLSSRFASTSVRRSVNERQLFVAFPLRLYSPAGTYFSGYRVYQALGRSYEFSSTPPLCGSGVPFGRSAKMSQNTTEITAVMWESSRDEISFSTRRTQHGRYFASGISQLHLLHQMP